MLLGVAVTGMFTQILRFAAGNVPEGADPTGLQYAAWGIYFVHLILVFDLLVCLPFSKFAHVLYRTVALIYAEHSGRNVVEAGKQSVLVSSGFTLTDASESRRRTAGK